MKVMSVLCTGNSEALPMRDAWGLFRGWCKVAPSCLEYVPTSEPEGPLDTRALICSRCRCAPQQHVATSAAGYDPHSEEQLALRRQYDERLQHPTERAAGHKATNLHLKKRARA